MLVAHDVAGAVPRELAGDEDEAAAFDLARVGWKRGKAARLLGVSRRALAEKLARLGVERGDGHLEGPPAA